MTSIPIDHPDYAEPVVAGTMLLGQSLLANVASGGQASTPVIDVTSFPQVLINVLGPPAGPNTFQVQQWKDAAGTQQQVVPLQWNGNGAAETDIITDMQAPYMSVQVSNNTGSAQNYNVNVFGITDPQQRSFIIPPLQLASPNQSVGAGVVANVNYSRQMAGPASLFGNGAPANWVVFLSMWNGTAWVRYAGLAGTAQTADTKAVILPFSDSRLELFNPTGTAGIIAASIVGCT